MTLAIRKIKAKKEEECGLLERRIKPRNYYCDCPRALCDRVWCNKKGTITVKYGD